MHRPGRQEVADLFGVSALMGYAGEQLRPNFRRGPFGQQGAEGFAHGVC